MSEVKQQASEYDKARHDALLALVNQAQASAALAQGLAGKALAAAMLPAAMSQIPGAMEKMAHANIALHDSMMHLGEILLLDYPNGSA